MSNKEHSVHFDESLEETDFGFIVCGLTGRLKGLWVPDNMEDQPVPKPIVEICKNYFGIDPTDEENEPTFH